MNFPHGDTIRVPAGGGAEERATFQVLAEIIEPGNDVGGAALAIGHPKLGEGRAVLDDFGNEAVLILQGVTLNRAAVRHFAEVFNLDVRHRSLRSADLSIPGMKKQGSGGGTE